ncbi:MAG: type ISP restriction/modification enzyme [bacterium]
MQNIENIFDNYIRSISSKFCYTETSEMGYRTDFELLLKGIFQSINVQRIDHDARVRDGNKPDFVVLNKDVPILYIEAKDIGVSLDKVEKSEQMARYFGYTNLVLTDYLEFRFYRNGRIYEQPIKIAEYDSKKRSIKPIPQNYKYIAKTLLDFSQSQKEPITSGEHLAKIMGGKAQRIRDNVMHYMTSESSSNSEIFRVYGAIRKMLVNDLTINAFSDMYAQTLVYGLFVARYYDESPDTFSRQESRDLVPASNPFLQHFFDHIAGPNFVKRLSYIVDEVCLVFQHSDIKKLIEEYMDNADPVIHFYEDFLKEYDPQLRKRMGAYYTPLPVVNFIVRSVDYLLQKEFNLQNGLADTSRLPDNTHRVQILDPAVGTGTFISSAIRKIYLHLKDQGQIGRWPSYVHHDLLPRLHGFELMMTPYTIAHLKLSIALRKTGFKYFNETRNGKTRLQVYLTNSLEKSESQSDLLSFGLADSIAQEAREAGKIKNETPIMVVIGNLPYSISSQNKGKWILDLIKDYKKGLNERKINLDDDYIKFIRFAEHFIEKNKSGIVAMITNNSFIDGVTHRQMRKNLLETFDDIYILDLHGNSKKKEKAPDGSKDENVFDIQQGVSISIFVRKNKYKKEFGSVYHTEIYGKRKDKFQFLNNNIVNSINWRKLLYDEQYYFFVPKDFSLKIEYEKGFSVNNIFNIYSAGIKTKVDNIAVDFQKNLLRKRVEEILTKKLPLNEIIRIFKLNPKTTWEYSNVLKADFNEKRLVFYDYRPFDCRYIYYDKYFLSRSRSKIMDNYYKKNNIGLETSRVGSYVFISKRISDEHFVSDNSFKFPLYIYVDNNNYVPNFENNILREFESIVGKVSPEDILDYIYAILHSPNYRERFKEFLQIDFPRVPYPKDKQTFQKLVTFGTELRKLHLLESPKVNQFITTYPIADSDIVEKISYDKEKVFINARQYFGNVPEIAWNFYIGGYQPARKWLKDRKGRTLTNADIEHYQKIIVVLKETDRIMKEIDKNISF